VSESLEAILKPFLSNESERKLRQCIGEYVKKYKKYCICCGTRLTVDDILGSQGFHCRVCFSNLPRNEESYICTRHAKIRLICGYQLNPQHGKFCERECEPEEQ
jgi:hypothetical protein